MSGKINNQSSTGRHAGISYLRILATVAVVFLHTCSTIEQNTDLFVLTDSQLRFFELGHTLCLWAVPVFFMITGSLLLKPGKAFTFENVRKLCKRILLALLVFGVPFAGLIQYASGTRGFGLIAKSLLGFITGDTFAHLWYLYLLIGLYCCMPMIKRFAEHAAPEEIKKTILSIFVLIFCTSMISRIAGIKVAFTIPVGYSLFYVLTGYYFSYVRPVQKKNWMIPAFLGLAIIEGIIVYTKVLPEGLEYYDSPLTAMQAVLLFVYFYGIKGDTKETVWSLDRLCFGVYLTHPLYIHLAYRFFHITPMKFGSFLAAATVLFALVFTVISFIGSFVLSMIRPVKKYIL